MNEKFKIGAEVSIREDSYYKNQINSTGGNKGVIKRIETDYYDVEFENGYSNTYHDEDLKLIFTNWKDRYKK